MNHRLTFVLTLMTYLLSIQSAVARPAQPIWRDSSPWSTERAIVTIGDQVLEVEIADTPPLQQRGLSYRDDLLPDTGMLFVFDESSVRTFWMRGMRFCLDIIWIEAGQIVGAAESVCPMPELPESDLPRYSSEVPVTYVLEMHGGWMAEHGFEAGKQVEIELPESLGD